LGSITASAVEDVALTVERELAFQAANPAHPREPRRLGSTLPAELTRLVGELDAARR
jgi:hypothetical protein